MKYLMKLSLVAALIAAVAFIGSSAEVSAQTKKPSYTSGVQFQNLEGEEATLQLIAYKDDGTSAGEGSYPVPANDSVTLFPLADVATGFSGSIVLSSNRNGAAIANILASDFSTSGSYVGRDQGATEVQLPLLNAGNSGFDTWFSVQNAGSAEASVSVQYSDGTQVTNQAIPVGASKTFFQSQESHSTTNFAGIISSDQPVVAAVIQESNDVLFAYTGFTGGSNSPVFPLVNANNADYVTGIQVQNAGNAETTVTLSYTPSSPDNGTACTETRTIAPGASQTYALNAFNSDNAGVTTTCVGGAKFVGSAAVTENTGNQPLVGIGNQLLPGTNGEAYGSFDPDSATGSLVMPLIMDRNSGYFTGFNVQNVGTVATPVNCTFTNSSYTVSTPSLAPGEALTDLQNGKIGEKYVGSAICTATASNAKIVAVVNQLGSDSAADQFLVYEAVNN